ncbi:MAG: isoprenylcysteine carboxylmethyltransferase family protein [Pseudomonadota bacterium]
MPGKMTVWGVGRFMIFVSLGWLGLAILAARAWPETFGMPFLPPAVTFIIGGLLLAVGVPLWLWCAAIVLKGFPQGRLFTSGPYACMRHPLYAAFILFLLPGGAFLGRSWPGLLAPLLMYILFRFRIHGEEDFLLQTFGEEYARYRSQVRPILPGRPYRKPQEP